MKRSFYLLVIVASTLFPAFTQAQCTVSITGDTLVCSGDTPTLNAVVTGPDNQLTTTMAAGNNHRGNMFDIVATNNVVIQSFDAYPQGSTTIAIYYKAGTWNGFANTPAAWTYVGSAAVTAAAGAVPVPLPVNVTIPAGQTYAFYVTSTNTAVSLNYTDGTTVGAVYASDANISFLEGAGMEYPFTAGSGSVFTPRIWNGNIHYVLLAPPAISYLWNTTETNSSIQPTITTPAQYFVEANVSGCPAMHDTVDIMTSVPPVDAGSALSVCAGDSVTLAGSGAETYAWDNGVMNNTAFVPTGDMTYTVTGTDSVGCTVQDQVFVEVRALPAVFAGSDFAVCTGDSITLDGQNADLYLWDNGVVDGEEFAPVSTSDYILTGTDLNGCSNTDTITVTVNNLPAVFAGSDFAVCTGDSITLDGQNADLYLWDNGVVDGEGFAPGSTSDYILTGTDLNGCSNTDTITVTVNNLPAVSAGSDFAVCTGDSITLDGQNADLYLWDNGVVDGEAFVPGSTSDYILTGTDLNGCSNTDTITVTVNNLPAVSAGSDFAVCTGDSITLDGQNADLYLWDNGVIDGEGFMPESTSDYILTGTDTNGCLNMDTVTVTVNTLPTVSAGNDQDVCEGAEATLNGSGADTYSWSNGVTDGDPFVPAALFYVVTGTDTNGCSANDTMSFTLHTLIAQATLIDAQLFTGSVDNGTYQWINCLTMVPVTGETDTTYAPSATGNYAVVVTSSMGCSDTSACVLVDFTGLAETVAGKLSVFPVPSNDKVTFRSEGNSITRIELIDMLGNIVGVSEPNAAEATIDLSAYAGNQFFARVYRGGDARLVKLLRY